LQLPSAVLDEGGLQDDPGLGMLPGRKPKGEYR
jgi:hypothetical protein